MTQTYFSGNYVQDMVTVAAASALSGVHMMAIGAPGWGKTRTLAAALVSIFGDRWCAIRFDGSTPPEKVYGPYNIALAMQDPPQFVNEVKGTPYDPDMLAVLADELGRANEVLHDIFIDLMDMLTSRPISPVVFSTSNFIPPSDRLEAMIDRFGFWVWIEPRTDLLAEIARSQIESGWNVSLNPDWKLPSQEEVLRIRSMTPTQDQVEQVLDVVEALQQATAEEIGRANADVLNSNHFNPRRAAQWTRILFSMSMWESERDGVPFRITDGARQVMRYAWPSQTRGEADAWKSLCQTALNYIDVAIERLRMEAMQALRQIASRETSGASVAQKVEELGTIIQQTTAHLREIGAGDKGTAVVRELQGVMAKAARGETI